MASELADAPWVVTIDESHSGAIGMALGQVNAAIARDVADPEHNEGRKGALWASIMAGGAGMNTYVGFGADAGEPSTTTAKIDFPDLMLQDFRLYDRWWDHMRVARAFFFENKIPLQEMSNRSELVSAGWALAGAGIIVAYFSPRVFHPTEGMPLEHSSVPRRSSRHTPTWPAATSILRPSLATLPPCAGS